MCFSASASFVTAGFTGAIGIVSLARVRGPRELALAAVPLCFAFQQSIEGVLWLYLPSNPDGTVSTGLTLGFLLFAEVFWPVYAPLTVWLVEPGVRRRRAMLFCFAIGVAVGGDFLWWLLMQPRHATIEGHHIVYVTEADRHSDGLGLGYLVAVSLPLLLSSRHALVALGAIVLTGCVVADIFYWEAFISVWCFFAAAASMVIVGHFGYGRRQIERAFAAGARNG